MGGGGMNTLRAGLGNVVLVGVLAGLFALGCGASGSTTVQSTDAGGTDAGTKGGSPACQAETFRNCRCSDGASGTETCEGDGKWGTCSCTKSLSTDAGGTQPKPECGDGVCNGKETCATCPDD